MIDWANLRNPILRYDDWSIKDACMVFRDGLIHLFFSAFDEERSFVTSVTTTDFRTFSDFRFLLDGRTDSHIGYCSPDVMWGDGRYVMVFNSWGDHAGDPNQLFYRESPDLQTWSETQPLAHNLTAGKRVIDGTLAYDDGAWRLFYKAQDPKYLPFAAVAPALDGPWERVGDGPATMLAANGIDNGLSHENFQLLQIDGQWRLVSTDYSPHHPWLYTQENWARWTDGYRLDIPQESWNMVDVDNAAALLDLRAVDGHFYLIYGGKNETRRQEFNGTAGCKPWPRGWNALGLARSRDLVTWVVPG